MNTKLHAVTDANGRPISLFMTAGQVSDYTGAAALLDSLPKAQWLLGDRGYDADWFRDAGDAPPVFQSAEHDFDAVSAFVPELVVTDRHSPGFPTGDAGRDALGLQGIDVTP